MARYSDELKASVIQKMMPPNNIPVSQLERETGITNPTLYTWRKQAKAQGVPVPGIGDILSMTILLEIGDINRFNSVGNFASYSRCVESKRISNNKKKGKNNRKCGNRYLSWAFHEAAHHGLIFYPEIKKFYDRKKRKSNGMIAIRAVAHKLARACYYVLKTQQPFDMSLAFR